MEPKPKKPANWARIRAAYESGEGSYRQLAAKFGVALSTLERRGKKEMWVVSRRQSECKVTAEIRLKSRERKVHETLSDMEVIDQTIARLFAALDDVEPKSLEGVANAIARVIEAKAKLLNPSEGDRIEGFNWTRLIIEPENPLPESRQHDQTRQTIKN